MEQPRIVVGVDGSTGSLHALRWALADGRRRGSAVEAVLCWHFPVFGDASGMVPYAGTEIEEAAELTLAGTLKGVEADAVGVSLTGRTVVGPTAPALIDASATAELVVVGRRGHGGFMGLMLGSVALQIAGHAKCPVAIIPDA
jgi:nucleotide-binding universal stress UspA family protein